MKGAFGVKSDIFKASVGVEIVYSLTEEVV